MAFTFFLDKKSNKKIKAKRIAPLVLPLPTHKFQNYWLRFISVLVIFSFHVISLHLSNFFGLMALCIVHTAGAVPTRCSSLPQAVLGLRVGKALENSINRF